MCKLKFTGFTFKMLFDTKQYSQTKYYKCFIISCAV